MPARARTASRFKNAVLFSCLMMLMIVGNWKPAFADNRADEVADRIEDLLKGYGATEISFSSATYDGAHDEVTITDLRVVGPEDEKAVVEADELILTGAITPVDGTLKADTIILISGSAEDEDGEKLTFARMTELDVDVPTKAMVDNQGDAITYSVASEAVVENLVVGDDPRVLINRIHYLRGALEGQIPTSVSVKIEGIEVNIEDIDDEDGQKTLQELGYDTLNINIVADWSWNSDTNDSGVAPVRITVTDAGGYEFRTEFGGITYELLTATNAETAMQHVEKVTLKSAEFVYNDDSAMERMLSYSEREADIDRKAVIAIWLSKIRDGLAEAGAPKSFSEMVLNEFEIFFNNPEKLRISITPPQPVPAGQIMGSIMFGPGALIPLLNILVTAN